MNFDEVEKELKKLKNELNDLEQRVESVLKASSSSSSNGAATLANNNDTKSVVSSTTTTTESEQPESDENQQQETLNNNNKSLENETQGASSSSTSSGTSELDELFKERVNEFLRKASDECREQEENFSKCKSKFQKVTCAFCVKPRTGDSEVTPEYFFSLWVTFGQHFKDAWKRETQKLVKQR